ncbi:TetR/AcrR family transcriptional regulator [Virgibacillus doumboii]|uniref:TetR/AcrR family transcriptional regulator n=1 Tax=Virgibacillus doumboii TaxID=2697503 RepID=UPI0013DFF2AC|nr:TetR/AcrR family transcriptional regulator [Virgibacillus doumboii]
MLNKTKYMDKRIIKSKESLKNALISLLFQKSYHKISIADIVNAGKVSRVTFYNHYQSKEKLLNEIIDEVIDELLYAYRKPYQHFDSFTYNDLTPSAVVFFEHVYKHSTFYSTIVKSEVLPFFQNRLTSELTNLNLQDYRLIKSKVNQELFAEYIAYAVAGLIIEWVRKDYKYSPKYMADQLLEIVMFSPVHSLK